ncbi:precorrin-6A synthase (deacetylating) [Pseudomonas sp. LJDD11]|uniref:precorrin-6A synthase (deacetylating) n=1 Tax=unclassified Pseudomonas TaxID=196821 RepID=UPI0004F8F7CD|nr:MULTISPECIES: precorrin-6A synthase (deacetylating) [unclassified Pseudomonas]MCQ9425716.1 precorrin-6A synthase (deacetylating) [Pseudomonas sp. LJDD11]BAP45463.1 precorrin 6A synthase [Pseudomonas sp. StFLB209]
MKTILIIGIGAGNPDYLTVQAVNALNQVDVFFLMDKGLSKGKLNQLRRDICERYIKDRDYRMVEAPSPSRAGDAEDYRQSVAELNAAKQLVFERLIDEELQDGQCGAFLVWGDPSLYDSTIRIIEAISRSGRHALDYQVIPGISSVQALAAQHKVALNNIGRSIAITPGRLVAEGFADNVDSVVVMLDAGNGLHSLVDQDLEVYWGAYLGTEDEILVSGKLHDVVQDIERLREQARAANGWIMDTCLLKRPE